MMLKIEISARSLTTGNRPTLPQCDNKVIALCNGYIILMYPLHIAFS